MNADDRAHATPASQPDSPDAGRASAPAPTVGAGGRVRIGQALVEQGEISSEQLQRVLSRQQSSNLRLGELLLQQGLVTPTIMVRTIAKALGVPGANLRHGLIDASLLPLIGAEDCERLRVIPMFRVRGELTVAMAEPQSLPTIDRLSQLTGCAIRPVFALEENILEYIRKYASGDVDVDDFLTSLTDSDVEVVERESVDEGPTTDLDRMVAGSPIINLVNVALLTAVKGKASDIHIEPDRKGTRIRYRIDGTLRDLMKPPAGMHAAIVSRVKVIGKMDIAEKRLPQEGRVRIVAEGRDIDLRVSSMPTLLGEKLVIRILDKENLRVRMEDLGFRTEALKAVKEMLFRPHGLVLVTGPTGSGKTTTLYSALDLLRSPESNLVTVEDPVEYQLDLINQIQVHEQIGMTFGRALRSILRQDPDIIMVGEIRDEETARVAVQAALTGHLVLATLHTNDAPGAVARLSDMGLEHYLLSSSVNGVIAQRLARTICPSCQSKYYPEHETLEQSGLLHLAGKSFRKGLGCHQCHDTGFQGRVGVYEVMPVSARLRRMIHAGAPTHDLREQFRKAGGLSLRDEAVAIAVEGLTSLEEALRVTHQDDQESAAPATDDGASVAGKPVPPALAKEAA